MVLLLLLLQAVLVSDTVGFVHTTCKIDYYDKLLEKNVEIAVYIYCPTKDVESNGHLVMIANGVDVSAKEYSHLSERLSGLGYFVVTADFQTFVQEDNRSSSHPNMDFLHSLLKQLINAQDNNNESDLPNLNFKDVIILGHAFGGFLAISDAANSKAPPNITNIVQNISNFFPDERSLDEYLEQTGNTQNINFYIEEKEEFWDKFVKGVVVFEGWSEKSLLVPKKNKFLVVTGSQQYKKIMQLQQSFLNEELLCNLQCQPLSSKQFLWFRTGFAWQDSNFWTMEFYHLKSGRKHKMCLCKCQTMRFKQD